MRFLRNVISTALIVLPMSLGAQESVDYLRRENKRLRYERDSLMAVIDGFRSMSISTWDMLTDLEFEDDIAALPSVTFVKADGTVAAAENGWDNWTFRISANRKSLEFRRLRGTTVIIF